MCFFWVRASCGYDTRRQTEDVRFLRVPQTQKKQKMPLGQAIAVACGATFGTLFFCDRLLIKQKTTGVVGGAFVGYVVAAGAAHVLMGPFRGGGINMNSVVEMGVGLGGAICGGLFGAIWMASLASTLK